jgi:transcriptional regulator with XRE-family HTH domain
LKNSIPQDYSARIKVIRHKLGLTQTRLAELMGVSFASVNRWENGQARPNLLAWKKIERVEVMGYNALLDAPLVGVINGFQTTIPESTTGTAPVNISKYILAGSVPEIDNLATPILTTEKSTDLSHASSKSSIIAPDTRDEKIFMAGLYMREMLTHGLIQRILIIAPARMLTTWEREMRAQFDLSFVVLTGIDAGEENPFKSTNSDLMIASLEMLADDTGFALLREPGVKPYDVAILDEPHSTPTSNGSRRPSSRVERHQVADAFAGVRTKDKRWQLPWTARHLLLLSARRHRKYVD